eukprot:XP_001691963.1 predicted protein [Chlamydomonas reinhardtii]
MPAKVEPAQVETVKGMLFAMVKVMARLSFRRVTDMRYLRARARIFRLASHACPTILPTTARRPTAKQLRA